MLKTISILFVASVLASCGKHNGSTTALPKEYAISNVQLEHFNDEFPEVFEFKKEKMDVPELALSFETEATLINFSQRQEKKVERALELIKQVIASEKFKNGILSKKYNGKKQFKDNGGLSNLKIYNKILEASEKFGVPDKKNNILDVEVELYTDNDSPVLGYTYPNVKRIWINKKYFNDFQAYQVAGNLFHEWLHKLGFKHNTQANSNRKHSVPYSIGYLVRNIAKEIDEGAWEN